MQCNLINGKTIAVKDDDVSIDIRTTPFGRRLSYISLREGLYIDEHGHECKQLGLFRLQRKYSAEERAQSQIFPGVMSIHPFHDGASALFHCTATPSMLELRTDHGYVQFCFDCKDLLRIRGKGTGLRFFSKMKAHEICIDRLDGTYQATYDMVGEFLFVPLHGKLDMHSQWDWKDACCESVTIDISPDADGEFELALHFRETDTERCPYYRPFEVCVEEAQKDFSDWLAMYPPVPAKYEGMKKLAAYCIWICSVAPMGLIKSNIITYEKTDSVFAWHGAFHAMTLQNDLDFSIETLMSIFEYQDDFGQIPDMVDDRYVNYLATKPPYHGITVLYLLDHMGDRITKEHCEAMYGPMVNLCNWWTTIRDTDNDGVPQYNQGCEQSFDYSVMFAKGVPVECPDLIAYIVLLEEALSRLAARLGRMDESERWLNRSKTLLDTLIQEFWDGEKFIARLSSSHEIIEFDEIDTYAPIMLGKRLPDVVVDKVAQALSDPEKYYTQMGFRANTEQYVDGNLLPGIITGCTQLKLVPGLVEAGKADLARDILTGFCDITLEKMPMYRYLEFEAPKGLENEISVLYYTDFGVCSALSCVFFLILASTLAEISK